MGLFFHKKKEKVQEAVSGADANNNVAHITMDEINAFKSSAENKSKIPDVLNWLFKDKDGIGDVSREQVKQNLLAGIDNPTTEGKHAKEVITLLIPDVDLNSDDDDYEEDLEDGECVVENTLDVSDKVKKFIDATYEESFDDFDGEESIESTQDYKESLTAEEDRLSEEKCEKHLEKMDNLESVLENARLADKEYLVKTMQERNWPLDWVIQDYLNYLSNLNADLKDIIDENRGEFVEYLTSLVNG